MQLKASTIVIVPQLLITNVIFVNPGAGTKAWLKKADAWTYRDSFDLIDTNKEGKEEVYSITNSSFIDAVQSNSQDDVILVRFMKRDSSIKPDGYQSETKE